MPASVVISVAKLLQFYPHFIQSQSQGDLANFYSYRSCMLSSYIADVYSHAAAPFPLLKTTASVFAHTLRYPCPRI